jgi:cytochrome c-type biogenesis protein CcmH/NrfG
MIHAAAAFVLFGLLGQTGVPAQAPLAVAVGQVQAGQFQEAVATLEAAIRSDPRGGENLYLLLAECHMRLADFEKGQGALRAGLRVYPGAPILERALGQLLFRAKFDSSEAGVLLANAAAMMPRDPQAALLRAVGLSECPRKDLRVAGT